MSFDTKVSIQLIDLVHKNQIPGQFNYISYFDINYWLSIFYELFHRAEYPIYHLVISLFPAIVKKTTY